MLRSTSTLILNHRYSIARKSALRLISQKVQKRSKFVQRLSQDEQLIPSCSRTLLFEKNFVFSLRRIVQFSTESIDEAELTREYEQRADLTLDLLDEYLEKLPDIVDCHPDFDVVYSQGVLTLTLGGTHGTYVINKQTPNRQIWLSSPFSGPKRYDFIDGQWIYAHDGISLQELLTNELRQLYKSDIVDLSALFCDVR